MGRMKDLHYDMLYGRERTPRRKSRPNLFRAELLFDIAQERQAGREGENFMPWPFTTDSLPGDSVLYATCPKCGCEPGYYCQTPRGTARGWHRERIDTYRASPEFKRHSEMMRAYREQVQVQINKYVAGVIDEQVLKVFGSERSKP